MFLNLDRFPMDRGKHKKSLKQFINSTNSPSIDSQMTHEKKPSYFPWVILVILTKRDPYNGLWNNPQQNWVVGHPPL